ncbi:MAG: cytochrome c biogenesis protein CcsA [Planctomycetes bacterium]|nr:cytochrome c biogenesis protein CcsA [Planctomycetota bacterium]
MDTVSNTAVVILTVLYTLLVIAYARIFTRSHGGLAEIARPLLVGTVSLQLASILLRSFMAGACPLNNRAEFLSLVAFSIAVTYLIVELSIDERSTGVFAVTPAFVLQAIATVDVLGRPADSGGRKLGLLDSFHTFAAIVGFSAVALGSVYGILYLVLYTSIKRGRFGLFYRKMPSLETLSELNFIVTCVAFLAITVTAGLGLWRYLRAGEGAVSLFHAEVLLTFLLWLLYGGCVLAKLFFGFGGKRLAYTTVLGLLVMMGILLKVFFTPGFHF